MSARLNISLETLHILLSLFDEKVRRKLIEHSMILYENGVKESMIGRMSQLQKGIEAEM